MASRARTVALRLALIAAALVGLLLLFRKVDWSVTEMHLGHLGLRALLVPLPAFFILLSDTVAWRATFERPHRLPLAPLWSIRATVDAVTGTLPGGVAAGESLRVLLLERRFGMSIAEAASNAVVSRLVMAVAQGVFLVCGIAMAGSPIRSQSASAPGALNASVLSIAVPLAFSALMGGALVVLSRGRLLGRVLGWVQGASGGRWRAKLARLEEPLSKLDRGFAMLAGAPRRQIVIALAMFFVGWLWLGIEGWLILRLLAAPVSLGTAISIEAIVSMVRIGFFFLPGGLGAQEASYYGLLKLYGVPHAEAIAAAFVIVKRAKEVFWIAIGYLLLLRLPARASKSSAALPAGAESS
jgi:uncharacterized protein (TIRG00374 family)